MMVAICCVVGVVSWKLIKATISAAAATAGLCMVSPFGWGWGRQEYAHFRRPAWLTSHANYLELLLEPHVEAKWQEGDAPAHGSGAQRGGAKQ
jgi:hypothetical protein